MKVFVPAEVVVACVAGVLLVRGDSETDALRRAEAAMRGEGSTLGDLRVLREVSSVLLTLQAHDMLNKGAKANA